MTTSITPENHSSLVGGSTAARRMKCKASWAFEQEVPKEPGSVYAQEGTTLHEIMALLLEDPDLDPYDLLPFTYERDDKIDEVTGEVIEDAWSYTVTEEIWEEHGQPALDAFLDHMDEIEAETGAPFEYIIEKSCEMPGIPGAFGTSDVIWKCGYLSGVWDWKFGFKKVFVLENDQLIFYARAAMTSHPEMFGAKSFAEIDQDRFVEMAIMQPQAGHKPDTWRTTVQQTESWRVKLMAAIKEGQTKGKDATIEKGKHCDFAPCKVICPLWVNPAKRLAEKLARVKDQAVANERQLVNEPDFMSTLPDLLELAELAESWAKEVFAQAKSALDRGDVVPGWKLKEKRSTGREFVIPEEDVIKLARNRKITLDEVAPRKLLSAPQFETLLIKKGKLKKGEKLPDDWAAAKPSSGSTMTRADDPAPEYKDNAARVRDLAEKLAHVGARDKTPG